MLSTDLNNRRLQPTASIVVLFQAWKEFTAPSYYFLTKPRVYNYLDWDYPKRTGLFSKTNTPHSIFSNIENNFLFQKLPSLLSSDDEREILALMCRVHELEADKMALQSERLVRQHELKRRDLIILRYDRQRQLCEEIITRQRQIIEGIIWFLWIIYTFLHFIIWYNRLNLSLLDRNA